MKYEGLQRYLEEFQHKTGLTVVVKDFVGILEMDLELLSSLHNFYIHNKPFCMAVKSNRRLWDFCLLQKNLLYKRLIRDPQPFYGNCYAGISEYVIPVTSDGIVIAALTVGCFKFNNKLEDKISYLSKVNGLTYNSLLAHYNESTIDFKEDFDLYMKDINKDLNIIAEYLSLVYKSLIKDEKEEIKGNHATKRPYILSHALEYLKLNYKRDVTLEEVATFCHCSKSYISHQFKHYSNMTMKTYINVLRIKEAKRILKEDKQITEIAFLVGFKDSNYFSKVFRDIEGITPSEYKSKTLITR
jgi:AraC-like DNA-binding protein/ligand-binding sensor protein